MISPKRDQLPRPSRRSYRLRWFSPLGVFLTLAMAASLYGLLVLTLIAGAK